MKYADNRPVVKIPGLMNNRCDRSSARHVLDMKGLCSVLSVRSRNCAWTGDVGVSFKAVLRMVGSKFLATFEW